MSPGTDATRKSLLIRIKDLNDSRAWDEFSALYRPIVYRFARARGLERAEAEDVVQECMSAITREITTFVYDPSRGRFRTWLLTVAENRVQRIFRARKPPPGESGDLRAAIAQEPDPAEQFERIWEEEHLRVCLGRLRGEVDELTYRAFQLYVIEQEAVEIVCQTLNLKPDQVYKIKWRITQRLKEKMEEILGPSCERH